LCNGRAVVNFIRKFLSNSYFSPLNFSLCRFKIVQYIIFINKYGYLALEHIAGKITYPYSSGGWRILEKDCAHK
jgi:hypothetical protein